MPMLPKSISDFIIAMAMSGRNSREFHRVLNERNSHKFKKESVRVAIYRLGKRGYLKNSLHGWVITKKGANHTKQTGNYIYDYIPSPFTKDSVSKNVIAFDIPEIDRRKRLWLRNQLKIFHYKKLQQSLWRGPGPFPQEFLKHLAVLGIRDNVKIFSTIFGLICS